MKTVLITGASRGIGLEFVRQLARREPSPVFVFASCRSPDRAEDLQDVAKSHKNVKIIKIDVQNESTYGPAVETVSKLVGATGLNVLINNAGIASRDGYETVSRETLSSLFDINVIGPIRLTQVFLPLLRQGAHNSGVESYGIERGAVLNISSGLGSISTNTSGGFAGYRESKAALNMFSKSLSLELKADKILVLCQCPCWVSTADAPRTHESSITDMLQIFSMVSEEHNGCFFANEIPLKSIQF